MYSEALGREVRQVDRLIGHYAESHRHPSNVLIHWICVPIIVWCTLTLFWVIHPYLAAGASALAIVYYARLSLPFTLVMAAFAVACLASLTVLPHAGWIALALFGLAVGKIVFVDVFRFSTAQKIITFISVGLSLLFVSFLYNRLKDKLAELLLEK